MKFRKKPIIIEAVPAKELIHDASHNWSNLPDWIKKACDSGLLFFTNNDISIKTLEGTMVAESTDMVIQGISGEIYPCKPDIFDMTYEVVG